MCHIILQHYRFIKKMNNMKTEEFADYIYNISPAIYSAFKNKGINNTKDIIADYITIVDKTINSIKNKAHNAKGDEARILNRYYRILCLRYTNKNLHSAEYIEQKLKLGERNLCKHLIESLKLFVIYFNQTATRLNHSNALTNSTVRVVEIARLVDKAEKLQKIA